MRKIESQQELDAILQKNYDDGQGELASLFVLLNCGLRSSKDVCFENDCKDYFVYNYIDDTNEIVKHDEIGKNILGEALKKGALYLY